ncbi:MAG: ATP-binding protein [Pseudobutyrivibrio sp.]|uniref:AAA family ATPase n=1 Tax=Pseudobutyrivibrio sp. TaxID=2014367 RepID=UPI0025CC735A|nr:ATP-binding protein [Pseudobutyrivibrio sp.]MBQ8489009.1 ATP-binding protein [Pseudobutyrivibrio sp.]
MNTKKIIGRIEECERLNEVLEADSAQLVIVYGRRRVGKTYLINQYFENKFAFKVTGAYMQPKAVQIKNFIQELSRKTKQKYEQPTDWYDVFELIRNYIEDLPEDEKQVFFFDELPWMDTNKSDFLPAFEWFWNDYASTKDNVVFIVCGSATSWMVEHISHNKGGLFNRQTCRLYLKPFTLAEVEQYLLNKNFIWSRYDIAECYMIMGGIPYYLSLLKKNLSLSQNIDALFFKDKGELWDEFEHLYATLFSNSDVYVKIVELLSKKRSGLTRQEIIESGAFQSNGSLSKILNNLVDSGFIRINAFYGKKKKEIRYQLCDYYTAFYLYFIRDNYGKDEHFWTNSIDNPSKRAWTGLTFEQVCKDHVYQIKKALGVSGVLSEESVWQIKGGIDENGTAQKGAQIDLLIERRDRVINICEIKYSQNEYEIDKSYDMELRNKIERFRRETNNKNSLQLTLITTYGLKRNMYSNIASNQVILDDLFE